MTTTDPDTGTGTAPGSLGHGRHRHDQHGNAITAPAAAVELYDQGVDALLRLHPDVVARTGQLLEEHPDAACGHMLHAYLQVTSTDEGDVEGARAAWDALGATAMNEREVAHHDAIGAWVVGDWAGAAARLDRLSERWPADLLALQIGHQLDFFVGDAANLRDRPGRALADLDPQHPHTAFVRGMQAFGLEESGDYEASREAGLGALEHHPDDVWALHAVAHTYEMQGRVDDGIAFMESRRADWDGENFFAAHNAWHLAVYYLEAGATTDALGIYDASLHNQDSAGIPLEMLDASALLWRLTLDGHDTGARWSALADAWLSQVEHAPWYAFNDLHATMALVGAGRVDDAEGVVVRLAEYVHRGGPGTNVTMTEEIGLPASRAVIRFAQGRYDDVIAELVPIRRVLQHFGGSHAQRDVLQRTLLEAALRSGNTDLARALISERLSVREASVYGWTQRARLLRDLGRAGDAASAERKAAADQDRFAAAMSS